MKVFSMSEPQHIVEGEPYEPYVPLTYREVKEISLVVTGEPCAKGRPKFSTRGGFVKTYTPEKTANYETLVKYIFLNSKQKMLEGEITAIITAYFSIPKSKSKKIQALMQARKIRPTKKPDVDNLIKIVCDALNGLAYQDDSQVVKIIAEKYYSEQPKVVITLFESQKEVEE